MSAAADEEPAPTAHDAEAQDTPAREAEPDPLADYVFDSFHVPVAVEVLDAALSLLEDDGPLGWGLVEGALEGYSDVDPALARELRHIAARDLEVVDAGGAGCEFVLDGVWLPDPKDVSDEVVALWRECAPQLSTPAAVAHVEELLVARRDGNVGERARRAATAYLELSTGPLDYQAMLHLARAWTLSRQYRLPDVEGLALDQIAKRVGCAKLGEPGMWLPLLAIMCRQPTDLDRREALHTRAEDILARFAATSTADYIVAEIGDLRRSLIPAGPDAEELRRATRLDELVALRRAAETTDRPPIVRQYHLANAAEFATRHGFGTELKEIQAELEAISLDDLGLQRFRSTGDIPAWIPEREIRRYARCRSWQLGLDYFLHTDPPTSDVEYHRTTAGEKRGVLRSITPTFLLGHNGLPRKKLNSPEEELAHDMSRTSEMLARHVGVVHAVGLERLAARHGTPGENDIRDYLVQTYNCDPAAATMLAKSFRMFWRRDYLEAVHLATPAVEAAARRLLRELDVGVYEVQLGKTPGKYPSLHTLLDELDKLGLDPSWSWFLRWLLLGPGANIRNDVAHGFFMGNDPAYTALVLRAASVLITASTSVDGETHSIDVLAFSPPRAGLRGLSDRVLSTVSAKLLRAHLRLESLRAQPARDTGGTAGDPPTRA